MSVLHVCQKPVLIEYRTREIDADLRMDLFVADRLPVELKVVENIQPIFEAQLLTYMRLEGSALGLMINFHVPLLKAGIKRMAQTVMPKLEDAEIDCRNLDGLAVRVLEAVAKVNLILGRGLLRSVYQACLCEEFRRSGIPFEREHGYGLRYRGVSLGIEMKIPILVEGSVPLFVSSCRAIAPVQEATLMSCLEQNELPYGFIINFNAGRLNEGICRVAI